MAFTTTTEAAKTFTSGSSTTKGSAPASGVSHTAPPMMAQPSATGDGLYLDCVAVHPKSAVGKNVTVRIPPEMIALALKTVKEFAIRQRSVALKGSEGQNDD